MNYSLARIRKNKTTLIFFVLILLGIMARIGSLFVSGSFWFDEIVTATIIQEPLLKIWDFLRYENSPPLSFLLFHLWSIVWGNSEIALRTLPIVEGIFTMGALFLLGKVLYGTRVGLMSAAIYSTASFSAYYDTEVRMYALAFLCSAISLYAFWVLVKNKQLEHGRKIAFFLLYLGGTIAALYTHVFAIFLLVIQGVYILIDRKNVPNWKKIIISQFFAFFIFIPWCIHFISMTINNASAGFLSRGWYFDNIFHEIPALILAPIRFFITNEDYVFIYVIPLYVITTIGVWTLVRKKPKGIQLPTGENLFVLLGFGIPLLLPSLVLAQFIPKYFFVSALFFYIIFAKGIFAFIQQGEKFLPRGLVPYTLGIIGALVYIQLAVIIQPRSYWKQTIQSIERLDVDSIVVQPLSSTMTHYYLRNSSITVIDISEMEIFRDLSSINRTLRLNWSWENGEPSSEEIEQIKKALTRETLQNAQRIAYVFAPAIPRDNAALNILYDQGFFCKGMYYLEPSTGWVLMIMNRTPRIANSCVLDQLTPE